MPLACVQLMLMLVLMPCVATLASQRSAQPSYNAM